MTANQFRGAFLRRTLRHPCWAALAIALFATFAPAVSTAAEPARTDKEIKEPGIPPAVTPPLNPPRLTEVRIWNISNRPFTYRLAKSTGPRWTEEMTLAPGKYQSLRIPKPGMPSELEGIAVSSGSSYETRFFGIRYPKYGGFIEANLPIENGDKPIPYWFHVTDPNGYSEMMMAPDVEAGREGQARLQKQKPLTPQEIERLKFTLRANWEFYDR